MAQFCFIWNLLHFEIHQRKEEITDYKHLLGQFILFCLLRQFDPELFSKWHKSSILLWPFYIAKHWNLSWSAISIFYISTWSFWLHFHYLFFAFCLFAPCWRPRFSYVHIFIWTFRYSDPWITLLPMLYGHHGFQAYVWDISTGFPCLFRP